MMQKSAVMSDDYPFPSLPQMSAVAASRGMSVDLTQHGKELVLGFKHGRRVSVYHVNGVRFLFKVKGERAKVREELSKVLPLGVQKGWPLVCELTTEKQPRERDGDNGSVLCCKVGCSPSELAERMEEVSECLGLFIDLLLSVEAWTIGHDKAWLRSHYFTF